MSGTVPGSLILIGPPGAGCSCVAQAIGGAQGLTVLDLGRLVADELGTRPDLALVAVPETEYRRVEADRAAWRPPECVRALSAPGSPVAELTVSCP